MTARPAPGPAGAHAVAHVFVDALDDRCEISGDDGHHLQRVRRITPGEIVTAADGSGAWRTYAVGEVGVRQLTLVAQGDREVEPAPRITVAVAVALTKGGLDDVVAAVTELGVVRITPVRTERVVVRWDETRARKAVARLRFVAREAAMQSRRARLPVVDEVVDLAALADRPGLIVADPGGAAAFELPAPASDAADPGWTVLVGPEGGLSPSELAAFAHVPRLRLGPHVLRASTAPVAAVAILGAEAVRVRPE
ncbi:MAG TPA: RsmE family RNA methyltransferase [Acidimicrobiia bacterium]|nr:RsmE family RNA methyltransferase [Acidimicrobiia bacterium]